MNSFYSITTRLFTVTSTVKAEHEVTKIHDDRNANQVGGVEMVISSHARYSFHSKTTQLTSSTSFIVAWYKADGVPAHCSGLAWTQPGGS